MSVKVYLETFLLYMLLNCTRSAYSYSKHHIKQHFGLSEEFVAMMDACVYLGLGIAYFLRYAIDNSLRQTFMFTLMSSLCALSYAVLPTYSLFSQQHGLGSELLIALSLFLYGFIQLKFLPVCLSLVNFHFTTEENGCLVGLWSSSRSSGNVGGYLLGSLLILTLAIQWELVMLIMTFIFLALIVNLSFTLSSHQQTIFPSDSQEMKKLEEGSKIKCSNYLTFMGQKFTSFDSVFYVLTLSTLKITFYSLLLWLPIYIDSKGFPKYSGVLPALFNIISIFGSTFIGMIYEGQSQASGLKCLSRAMVTLGCLIFFGLLLVVIMTEFDIFIFSVIIGCLGFVLGGFHNVYETNEAIRLNQGRQDELVMFVNWSSGVANCAIGVAQVFLGMTLSKVTDNNYDQVFSFLLVVSCILLTFLIVKAIVVTIAEEQDEDDSDLKVQEI